jgi:hypothetical protein
MNNPNVSTKHRSQPSHLVEAAASWSDHRRHSGEYQLLNIDKDGLIGKQTLAVIPGKRFAKG